MAKKKTNAKVVSKAKAKKTTKRIKLSAKSSAKTKLVKKQLQAVAQRAKLDESPEFESDLKISKFGNAQTTDEVVTDKPVDVQTNNKLDDLETLNQKLGQLLHHDDSVETDVMSDSSTNVTDTTLNISESATQSAISSPLKTKKITLEPVSAEMIEKSAQTATAQATTVTADTDDEKTSQNQPTTTGLADAEATASDAQPTSDSTTESTETIPVHIKTDRSEITDTTDDDTETDDELISDEQWDDELSDETAEQLASELDELDEIEGQSAENTERAEQKAQEPTILDDDEPSLNAMVSTIILADSEPVHIKKKPAFRLRVWLFLLSLIAVSGFVTWRLMMYQNITVDGHEYYTQSADQIASEVINQYKDHQISFKLENQPERDFKLSDVGIGIDTEKLTTQINQRRQLTVNNLLFATNIEAPLLVDYPVLQSSLDQYFKEKLINPTDATLAYNRDKNKFEIKPSVSGYRVDARTAIPDITKVNFKTKPVINVKYQPVEPITREADLIATENYLNERLKLRLNLNHNGKLLYFADPWDIASWVEFKTDTVTKKITVDFNKQKIQDFIEKTVSPEIARGVVNKKLLVDDKDQVLQVLQQGQRGLGAVNPGNSAEKIRQALLDNQNLEHDLDIQEIDFVEERIPINGLKWIEVNLTRQTTTLYSGDKALHTFTISSGVHPWPTPTGTYKVWFKNPIQRMRGGTREAGDYYDLPNVRWNTYFNRDIGFHTAYWHNNFGRPMSHGCINMREADARVVFDFAPIGTMVVVKY